MQLPFHELGQFFSYYNTILLCQAAGVTIGLTIAGCGSGYILGFGLALLRTRHVINIPPLRWLAIAIVEFTRRIPFLVLLFVVLFSFQAPGLTLPSVAIVGIAIALRTAVISSESIRAGIESVHQNQWDAASSMNIPHLSTLRYIILPQASRVFLVPSFIQFIQLLKSTSLASQLGVIELTYAAKILNRKGFSAVLCYGLILVIYYILCVAIERAARRMGAAYDVSRNQGA